MFGFSQGGLTWGSYYMMPRFSPILTGVKPFTCFAGFKSLQLRVSWIFDQLEQMYFVSLDFAHDSYWHWRRRKFSRFSIAIRYFLEEEVLYTGWILLSMLPVDASHDDRNLSHTTCRPLGDHVEHVGMLIFVCSLSLSPFVDTNINARIRTCFGVLRRAEWIHHCRRAARVLTRADFEPLKTVGKGQWGKVFLVRKCSGPVAGRAAADPGLACSAGGDNVSY